MGYRIDDSQPGLSFIHVPTQGINWLNYLGGYILISPSGHDLIIRSRSDDMCTPGLPMDKINGTVFLALSSKLSTVCFVCRELGSRAQATRDNLKHHVISTTILSLIRHHASLSTIDQDSARHVFKPDKAFANRTSFNSNHPCILKLSNRRRQPKNRHQ